MTAAEVVTYYGNKVKAAAALGVHPVTITNWGKSKIPALKQLAIQTLTKNKLKAD